MIEKTERILRFDIFRRIEHWINAGSFITLGITGLIQKYSESDISQFILKMLGGIENVRIIHRISAILLVLVSIYHLGAFVYGFFVQRKPLSMIPTKEDLTNAWQSLRYNFGYEKNEPKQGFYTFEEKFEYWALIWGTIIMGITGFVLWNPILSTKLFPSSFIPIAKAAHSGEALLAVLAVLIWHMYHVFIKHFNKSMYDGYVSREMMEHEHALVLEDENPWKPAPADDKEFQSRRKIFLSTFPLFALVLIVGLAIFVTAEETAVVTPAQIPDLVEINSYSPIDPTAIPTSISVEVADIGTSWEDGFADLFQDNCVLCHSQQVGQSNLNLTSYLSALEGGDSGPAIRPYAGGISSVVIWPARGDHPGTFTPGELAALRQWIDNGALEK